MAMNKCGSLLNVAIHFILLCNVRGEVYINSKVSLPARGQSSKVSQYLGIVVMGYETGELQVTPHCTNIMPLTAG